MGLIMKLLLKTTIILLICIFSVRANYQEENGNGIHATWRRTPSLSIAEQIVGGAKRVTYYLDTLLETCENIGDLNDWILFMDVRTKLSVFSIFN